MSSGGQTVPFPSVPGLACALCLAEADGVNVPVFSPAAGPVFPRVCTSCLGLLLGIALQLAGHAGQSLAALVVSMQNTGRPPAGT